MALSSHRSELSLLEEYRPRSASDPEATTLPIREEHYQIPDFCRTAYRDWLAMDEDTADEDAEMVLKPHVDAMAKAFERSNSKYLSELEMLEAENARLLREIEDLEKSTPDPRVLDDHYKIMEEDKAKFEEYNSLAQSRSDKYENRIQVLQEELDKLMQELKEADDERRALQKAVDDQGISMQDIDRMTSERERLQKGIEAATQRLDEGKRRVAEKEVEASRRLDELERLVDKYNTLAYQIGLIPASAANAKGEDYELAVTVNESDFTGSIIKGPYSSGAGTERLLVDPVTGYQPAHILNLDLRGQVKSSFLALRREISERRTDAMDAMMKDHELLDGIKEAIEDKRNEVEALEHRVRAAEEEYEKTKEVTTTQKLASDAQIEKMEKELAKMRAQLTESVQLLEQREMNTNIEYEQLTLRANALREELHTEIERMLNDVIKFKVHIQKNLEDYEEFARDELEKELGGGEMRDDTPDDEFDTLVKEKTKSVTPEEQEVNQDPTEDRRRTRTPSRSPSPSPTRDNYIRFAMRADIQQRTEPIDAAVSFFQTKYNAITKSWTSLLLTILVVMLSMSATNVLFQPASLRAVPDLVKVAGLARSFEPLIYYSENGVSQVGDLQATGVAVWDLGESVRSSNMTSAPIIVKSLDELSDSLKTLAVELTKFFANVDGDIDSILIVMDWARRELSQLHSLPSPPLSTAFSNLREILCTTGFLENPDTGAPTKLGIATTALFGISQSQQTQQTLQRTFTEFLSVLEEAIESELQHSLALFGLFEAIDRQFLNLGRLVVREANIQDEMHADSLSSLWTRILGAKASEVKKYQRNHELLTNVRQKTVRNKGILVEHNGRLLTLKANLESLRRKLVSPLVRSVNSSTLTLEDQIKGLEDVGVYLEGVRARQKGKLMEMLYGDNSRIRARVAATASARLLD
ncbi:hypothetical protein O1611_g4162 [Lasiodiplodia mahajangana]|uniref:Uncharacterized protein n=1 Tax=Lasiodiplodia mahajangana TaxID=1108764 RepID=A0ACC2JPQ1_9PEZI|nr:hypothetical protein O1611_g4162 [Lasiodiplodia mahajangana]